MSWISVDIKTNSLAVLDLPTEMGNSKFKPMFSSNGDKIAFVSNVAADYHLFTISKNGANMNQVTTIPLAGFHFDGQGYAWSNEKQSLIYVHYDQMLRITASGTNLKVIATAPAGRHFKSCDWDDVNNKIVVETVGIDITSSEIHLMDENGANDVLLVPDLPGILGNPVFAVDGQRILFTYDESGAGRQFDARIYSRSIDPADDEIIDLSDNKPDGTNDLYPGFSPNGAQIVLVNRSNNLTSGGQIMVMDATTGANRTLYQDNGSMPNWK